MIPLAWYDILFDAVTKYLAPAIEKLIALIFQPILDAISAALTLIFGTIGTFWIYVKTPAVGGYNGQPANLTVGWIWQHTNYIAIIVAAIGLVIGAIQMAWSQRGETARDLLRSLITLAVAAALSIGVAQALIEFGDQFSACLVTTALHDDGSGWTCNFDNMAANGKAFGDSMAALLGFSAAAGPIGIGLMITIGILTIIAGVIQIVLMIVRTAMLILLLGVLPIAAAATNTEMGRAWFKKIISWLLAFILYKPVAAIVYATAIRLTSNNGAGLKFTDKDVGGQIMNMVTGVTMLVLALFALPALMRFIVPMVAATASGAGAGALAAKLAGPGMDKLADKAGESANQSGGGDGPTGAQNVGRAAQQAPSSGPSGGGEGAAGGGEGAAAAGGGEGGAAAAAGGGGGAAAGAAGGGGAAAGGAAAGGAAAAAGPAAVAVVAVKAGMDATKAFGQMAVNETMGNDAMEEGSGGGGGGGGGGPSGSGGSTRDPSRENDRARAQQQQTTRDQPPPPRPPDGPRGSG